MNLNAITLAITRPGAVRAWDPLSLFLAGETGVWYDPSDLTTLYQDSAGTTPVTAVEQPVGLMLDKSKGLVLGPELVTNGDFSQGTTGWASVLGGSVSVINGVATFASSATSSTTAEQVISVTQGKWYVTTVDVLALSAGNQSLTVGTSSGGSQLFTSSSTALGKRTAIFYATANTVYLGWNCGNSYRSATIDNISVRELPGNHAYQTTSASRPVLSARVNQFVSTETLATQNVTTLATSYTLSFTGTGSITLSGTATGTYSAGTHSITCTAGTLTATVSGTVTKADLRVANDGVGLPAYQRVNTSTDYDTAGFPLYLKTDGVDDGMVTNSIDFSATDKMTVWAGVRKLSDAAQGIVAELSTSAGANTSSFLFDAPNEASPNYRFASRGAILASAVATGFTAPITNVITGIGNISGDQIILRVNGAQAAINTADQGTGNYGNYPLYLFRRGGTSLPFNGRMYEMIIRGAQSSAAQITAAETYVNTKTKAY
jgi:hypothetical protein